MVDGATALVAAPHGTTVGGGGVNRKRALVGDYSKSTSWVVVIALYLLAAASVVGCGILKPPLFLALETEHFEIYREDGLLPACDATGTTFEGYFNTFQEYLDVQLPEGVKIIYEQFEQFSYIAELCNLDPGQGASGCYNPQGDVIASVYSVHPHEIAHALEHRVGGFGAHPRLFEEGIAAMLGGGEAFDRPDHRVDASLPIEDLVDDQTFSALYDMPATMGGGGGALYSTAAGFVRYLIDTYGKDVFLRFYASVRGVTDGATVKRRLGSAAGVPFDDILSAWRGSAQPLVDDLSPAIPGCDQPTALSGVEVNTVDPSCEAARMRFDVPSSGRLDLLLNPNAIASTVQLFSCQQGSVMPERDLSVNGPMRLGLDVPPGAYEIVVTGAPIDVAAALTPVTIDLDDVCDPTNVPAVIGTEDLSEFAFVRRWGSTEKSVAFDVLSQSTGRFNVTSIGGAHPGTTPRRYYFCPDVCVTDLDGECTYDDEPSRQLPDGTFDNTHRVLGAPVAAGDLLHFATGPRWEQDWGYSVRLSIE